MKDHDEVVGLYRERARRLRVIAEGMDDPEHADFLRGIADEYEDLAARMIPRQ